MREAEGAVDALGDASVGFVVRLDGDAHAELVDYGAQRTLRRLGLQELENGVGDVLWFLVGIVSKGFGKAGADFLGGGVDVLVKAFALGVAGGDQAAEEIGEEAARFDHADVNAELRELDAVVFRERFERVLGGVVGSEVRQDHAPEHAGDVDDAAAAASAEVRDERAQHALYAKDVDVEKPLPVFGGKRLLPTRGTDAGVVDYYVNATRLRQGGFDGGVDADVASYVHFDDGSATGAEFLGWGLVAVIDVAHGADDFIAGLQEGVRGEVAEAAVGAGDEYCLAHCLSLVVLSLESFA